MNRSSYNDQSFAPKGWNSNWPIFERGWNMNGKLIGLLLVCGVAVLAAGCMVAVRTQGEVDMHDVGRLNGPVAHADRPHGHDADMFSSPGHSGKIMVKERPPKARSEKPGHRPSKTHIWVPGHWEWNGGWSWSAGFWAVPPRQGAAWVAGEWTASGDGWEFTAGFWR